MSKKEKLDLLFIKLSGDKEDPYKEWKPYEYHYTFNKGVNCDCGHKNIHHLYKVININNNNKILLGSTCIVKVENQRIIDWYNQTRKIMIKIKRLLEWDRNILNKKIIKYLISLEMINNWEIEFLNNVYNKNEEDLSLKQFNILTEIRKKIDNQIEEKKDIYINKKNEIDL